MINRMNRIKWEQIEDFCIILIIKFARRCFKSTFFEWFEHMEKEIKFDFIYLPEKGWYSRGLALLYKIEPEVAKEIHSKNNAIAKERGHSWLPIGTEVKILNPKWSRQKDSIEPFFLSGKVKAYLGGLEGHLVETEQGLIKKGFIFKCDKEIYESYNKALYFSYYYSQQEKIQKKHRIRSKHVNVGSSVLTLSKKGKLISGKVVAYLGNAKHLILTQEGLCTEYYPRVIFS